MNEIELENLLGKDLLAQVRQKLGNAKLLVDDGKLIPKHRFDCINISLKEHKERVRELTAVGEELKQKLQAIDNLSNRLRRLERENRILAESVSALLPYKIADSKEEQ